jgi:hypothetical protein
MFVNLVMGAQGNVGWALQGGLEFAVEKVNSQRTVCIGSIPQLNLSNDEHESS